MTLSRRRFFSCIAGVAGASAAFAALSRRAEAKDSPLGPLVQDPDGVIDLPSGFRYVVLQTVGDAMSDGNLTRAAPDGMAAFPGARAGEVVLMRNHELNGEGGVSRLVVATQTLTLLSSNDVLTGTDRNCAGGPSPWGWLSCEETPVGGVWLCPTDSTQVLSGEARRRIDAYGSFKHEAVCVDPDTLTAYLTDSRHCVPALEPAATTNRKHSKAQSCAA